LRTDSRPGDGVHFHETAIRGVWVIDPAPIEDERGRFMRAWCVREFAERGIEFEPVQANMGFSARKGTVRGMHFQLPPADESKLVRCTRGRMFDVALDLRRESPTFRQWHGVELSADNGRMLLVPRGCAHGYQSLEDATEMFYMTTAFYDPGAARGVRFDDPEYQVRWPTEATVISDQDRGWPLGDIGRQS
jgi:dTDP-4-dehydrorhamnose 3,5-epimerase